MNDSATDPLLHALAAGDERAFVVLYDRYASRLYRTALGMLGGREDAEDVVQDVFLATVRARESLRNVRDLTAYLFAALSRAAGRCAQRRARSPKASETTAQDAVAPVERASDDHLHWQRLQRAIRALPDEQREVLILKIDGELTFTQISDVLGISIGTAASRYRYALNKLRTSLESRKTSLESTR